jgi:ubiquinone/menaquinone biosynthesis C-methylase UbiE
MKSTNALLSTLSLFIIIVFTSICLLLTGFSFTQTKKRHLREAFENFQTEKIQDPDEFQEKDNYEKKFFTDISDIYDQFYTKVYSSMITPYKSLLCTFEVEDFLKNIPDTKEKSLLDIGCGTGHHLVEFRKAGLLVTGLDQSSSMLEESRKNLSSTSEKEPTNRSSFRLVQGDMQTSSIFPASKFDFCTCYYFSFYFSQNPVQLVNNVHRWLKPNRSSLWAVHLVDPEKFDPIIDVANPFVGFSLKRYIKKNVSKVYFKDMFYQSEFDYNKKDGLAKFREKFVLPKESMIRNQVQVLHMMPLEEVVKMVCFNKQFTLKKITDLQSHGYEYQYIYYFQRL